MGQTYNLGIDIEFRDGYKNDLKSFKSDLKSISKSLKDIDKISDNFYTNFSSSTKKASASLGKLEKRLDSVKGSMKNIDNYTDGVNKSLDNQGRNVNELSSDYKKLEKQLEDTQKELNDLKVSNDKVNRTLDGNSSSMQDATNSINKHKDGTNEAKDATDNFNSSYSDSMRTAIRSTAIWGLATTVIYGTKRALEEVAQVITEVDSQMVGVQKVMGDRVQDFREMEQASASLGKEYANNMPKVIQQMEEWGRQGKEQNEVIQLTEASLLSANATNIKSADSVKYLVSTMTQFNIEAENSMMIIDQWNEVANNFANTTAMDLAESMKEAGKPADSLGLKLNQLIGLTTAMAEATAKSGNRLGRSLRTIFANMAETTGDMEGYINGFEEMLAKAKNVNGEELNISLRSTEGEYRNLFDVIGDLSKKWSDLNQAQKLNISNLAGNKRRYSDFLSLVENFDTAIEASETALNSFGSALKENETYMESIEAQMSQARVAFESLSNTIGANGGESILKGLANALESTFVAFEDFINGVKEIKNLLLAGIGIPTTIKLLHTLASSMTATASAGTGLIGTLSGMFNPYVAGATLLAGAIFEISRAIGEAKREAEELKSTQETLLKIMDSGANVSYNQAIKASKAMKDLREELNAINNAQRNDIFGKNRTTMMDGIIEKAQGMEQVFPKLEEFNSRIAKIAYINDAVDKLDENLRKAIVSTNGLGSAINKTGEDFSNAVLKMGQDIDDKLISKLYDFEDKLYDLRTSELAKNELVSLKVDVGLLEGFDAEDERVNNLKSRVNSIGNLYVELQKMKDDAIGGVVGKGNILSALEERINNPKANTDVEMLENIKERVKGIQDPLDVWHNVSGLIKENFRQTAEELKKVEDRLKKGLSRSETRDTVEELLGITPQSISQAEQLAENIREAITKSSEVGLDTTKLKDALVEVNQYMDAEKFAQAEDNFQDNIQGLMSSYTGGMDSLLSTINQGRKLLVEGIKSGYDTSWLKGQIEQFEASTGWMKALFARSEGMNKRANQASGSDLTDTENQFYKDSQSLRNRTGSSLGDFSDMVKHRRSVQEQIAEGQEEGYGTHQLEQYLEWLNTIIDREKERKEVQDNINASMKANKDAQARYQDYINSNLTREEELRQNIQSVRDEIANNDDLTSSGLEDLRLLLASLKGDLVDLQQEARTENFVDYVNKSLERTKELVSELSNSSVFGMGNKEDAIAQLEKRLNSVQTQKRGLMSSRQWYNAEDFGEKMKEFGVSEKQIKKAIKELNKGIKDTKWAWADAIGDGLADAINNASVDSLGEGIGLAIKSVLSSAFSDDDMKADLKELSDGFGDMIAEQFGFSSQFGQSLSDGMMTGMKGYSNGDSIGKSVFSGIGTAMSSMGNPWGMAVSAVGSIGQSIWGGVEGLENKEAVEEINKQQEKLKENLSNIGVKMDTVKASVKNTASTWSKLWGGADYEAKNLEQAKINAENMEKALSRASNLFQGVGQAFGSALKEATSYSEFEQHFKQGIGEALKSTVIESIMQGQVIQKLIKDFTGKAFGFSQDGDLTAKELEVLDSLYNKALQKGKQAWDVIDLINKNDFTDDASANVNSSVDNSYSAGSTSNITYHQQFVVEAGAFMGDRTQAEDFARFLEPYITEVIERNQGN